MRNQGNEAVKEGMLLPVIKVVPDSCGQADHDGRRSFFVLDQLRCCMEGVVCASWGSDIKPSLYQGHNPNSQHVANKWRWMDSIWMCNVAD